MNPEYAPFAAGLLSIAGGAFQWVRAHSSVKEVWTYIYALLLSVGVYALCFDYTVHKPVQGAIIAAIFWIAGNMSSVLGGTFMASSAAKAGLAAVPMTNSKG